MFIITEKQKDLLVNKRFLNACNFNPIENISGNWLISEIEFKYSGFKLEDVSLSENTKLEDVKLINDYLKTKVAPSAIDSNVNTKLDSGKSSEIMI